MAPGLCRVSVLLIIAGIYFCEAALNSCRNVPGFELPKDNSYISYDYTVDSATNNCNGVTQKCSGSVSMLTQQSWYINPIKSQFGTHYRDRSLEIYRIQCPDTAPILHLFPQEINVELQGADCTSNDFITIERGQSSEVILCGSSITENELYNFGQGVLVEEGNATITFCTDGEDNDLGFVIRATCIDPVMTDLPGCVSFPFFFAWDPNFTDISEVNFPPPVQSSANRIHKRSSAVNPYSIPYGTLMKRLELANSEHTMEPVKREKRFIFDRFTLEAGQSATYENFMLTVDFNNGETETFLIGDLFAFNDLIKTKKFFFSANGRVFNGPANVEINELTAIIIETGVIDINAVLLLSPLASGVANNIADYIWTNYIRPYPIIDETPFNPGSLPLTGVDESGNFVRFSDIRLVRESIDEGSTCRRVVNLESSPARRSKVDSQLINWCRFFFRACNPYLAAICSQIDKLSSLS